jgi:thiol-disulfide isomerase/thioredoxin
MIDLRSGTWLGQMPLVDRPSLGAGPQEVSDGTFSQVLAAPKAMVEFWSPGCPACVRFKPVYEEIAAQSPGVLVAAVNTDVSQEKAGAYNIAGIPTVVFFVSGQEVHRVSGALPKEAFQAEMAKAFSGGGSPGAAGAPAPIGKIVLGTLGVAALLGAGYWLLKK